MAARSEHRRTRPLQTSRNRLPTRHRRRARLGAAIVGRTGSRRRRKIRRCAHFRCIQGSCSFRMKCFDGLKPVGSSNAPTWKCVSVGSCSTSQVRVEPQARQNPRVVPGDDLNFRDLTLGHRVGAEFETDEDGHGRTAVPATALAMTPEHPFGSADTNKADGAAQAATFVPFAHLIAPPGWRASSVHSTGRSLDGLAMEPQPDRSTANCRGEHETIQAARSRHAAGSRRLIG